MSRLPDGVQFDRQRCLEIRAQVLALNAARMQLLLQQLRPRQQDFLQVLPLLLHINQQNLPGYQSEQTPCGISLYQPDPRTQSMLRHFGRIGIPAAKPNQTSIQALYLMGSPGSLGYSGRSDLDIWVCHRPELSAWQLSLLQAKLDGISRYADSIGLEMHFFLVNPHAIRAGKTSQLDQESSGSAQQVLLLDEFYRSQLLIAGCCTLWWLVPPELEASYQPYCQHLLSQRFIQADEWLDLGPVPQIPPQEFESAALWQLAKAIDSPYKSLMKLLLIETYASDDHNRPLSLKVKELVYQQEATLERLDPYLMVYRQLEDYLRSQRDDRLELLRRSLYLKAGIKFSKNPDLHDWRVQRLAPFIREWGWSSAMLQRLDRQKDWKTLDIQPEHRTILAAFRKSYRQLSERARLSGSNSRIDPADLLLLDHKLSAAYERKPGKIEHFSGGLTDNPTEDSLSVHLLTDHEQNSHWQLFSGHIGPDLRDMSIPLKRDAYLLPLLAWCYSNRILGQRSQIGYYGDPSRGSAHQIKQLHKLLTDDFPPPAKLEMSALQQAPEVRQISLFINSSFDPMRSLANKGWHVLSDRSDPLAFGQGRSNLIQQLDLVWRTSWNELFVRSFQGTQAVGACLALFTELYPKQRAIPLRLHSVSLHHAQKMKQRMEYLLRHLMHLKQQHGQFSYLFPAGDGFQILSYQPGQTELQQIPAKQLSLYLVAQSLDQLFVDPNCQDLKPWHQQLLGLHDNQSSSG